MNRLIVFSLSILLVSFLTGCSSNNGQTSEQKIYSEYVQNNRVAQYHQLYDRYDGLNVVMMMNEEDDSWWITNFSLWAMFSILPDLPDALAGGGVIGLIYGLAWWLGVVLTGGGILAVLAYVGTLLGVIPGIPPAIMGIVYLGAMFAMLSKIFGMF